MSVDSLTVTYGHGHDAHQAVKHVSFSIGRGERVALVGESGSGKTTLALALAGFLIGDSVTTSYNRVAVDGIPVDRSATLGMPRKTPGITMVFQDAMTSLDPVWTVGSQVANVLRRSENLKRRELRGRMEYWLRRVGLHDTERVLNSRPYELSGGMRQRAMLAIALCSQPSLLIADEPTSALDASLAREVMDLMVQLTEEFGTSLLIVSHDIRLCQDYADRILVMLDGDLVDDVATGQIESESRHWYTKGLIACVPTLDSAGFHELPTLAGMSGGAA